MPRAVIQRLDAGESTVDRDSGKQRVRDPTGQRIVQGSSRKPKCAQGTSFAADGFEGPLRPILALLYEPSRLFQDPEDRGVDWFRGGTTEPCLQNSAKLRGKSRMPRSLVEGEAWPNFAS